MSAWLTHLLKDECTAAGMRLGGSEISGLGNSLILAFENLEPRRDLENAGP